MELKAIVRRPASMSSTTTTTVESGTRIPAAAQFDAWTAHEWRDGVLIDQLSPHDRLCVRTRNSTYELIVTSPHTAEVLVRGGSFFPDFTPAIVAGSSLGGSFLKLHGVYEGFQLEIIAETQPVVTTRIQSVHVVATEDGRVM